MAVALRQPTLASAPSPSFCDGRKFAEVEQALLWTVLQQDFQQHLDNLRRIDALRGAETTEMSARLGNYSASHFGGSAKSGSHARVSHACTTLARPRPPAPSRMPRHP